MNPFFRPLIRFFALVIVCLSGLLALAGCSGGGGSSRPSTQGTTSTYLRFAYVANSGDDTLTAYTIDDATGRLRANGYVMTGNAPQAATVAPGGHYVYTANSGADSISAFGIDANGRLTELSGSPFATSGTEPVAITIDHAGNFLYAVNANSHSSPGSVSVFSIDNTTGNLAAVTGSPYTVGGIPTSIALDKTGKYAYVLNSGPGTVSEFSIANGQLTELTGSPYSPPSVMSYAFQTITMATPGNFLYVATRGAPNTVDTLRIDATTGALTDIDSVPTAATSLTPGIAVDPLGRYVYVTDADTHSVYGFGINATTGKLAAMSGPFPSDTNVSSPAGIRVDPTRHHVYVTDTFTNNVVVYDIDAGNGALTLASRMRSRIAPLGIAFTTGTAPVTYTPKFAYVTDSGDDNVSAYRLSAATGALTAVSSSPFTAGTRPYGVAIDPANRYVYVANNGSNNISAYGIDTTSGALNALGSSPFAENSGESEPYSTVVDPSGRFLYVSNYGSGNMAVFSIDATTGALAETAKSPFSSGVSGGVGTIAVDPTGQFLYALEPVSNTVKIFDIDATSGDLTLLTGPYTVFGPTASDIAIDPGGQFLCASVLGGTNGVVTYPLKTDGTWYSTFSNLLTIDPTSMHLSAIPHFIAFDPGGAHLFTANFDNTQPVGSTNSVTSFDIDAATGVFTTVAGSPFQASGWLSDDLVVDPSGKFLYVTNYNSENLSGFSIAPASGVPTALSGFPVATGTFPFAIAISSSIK
ncbi:MAG: beta-propeller fold lactonase family protein [Gallionella sp.]